MERSFTRLSALALAAAATLAATSAWAQTDTTATQASAPAASTPEFVAVARAVICSGVAEREPVDTLVTIPGTTEKVFCFTEILGMEGRTVTHRWTHEGQMVAEVPISVGAARWRCYTTKTLAGTTGAWTVEVIDDAGNKVGEVSFTVSAP